LKKVKGKMLRNRRLSIVNSTVIALARRVKASFYQRSDIVLLQRRE